MTPTPPAPRRLRMILNTFVSGPQAWFFVADERGYFRDAGLAIDFTPGDTAANAVPRLADGGFDVAYGDLNTLIELAAGASAPPDAVAVYATFNASPYTIAVPAAGPVRAPGDLHGRALGAHPNDAALRLFPEFARAAGIERAPVGIELSSLPHPRMLREMLDERRWDGLFGFVNTLRAAAIEAGIDPAAALRCLEYRHLVPDLYGAALMVSRRLADTAPALVRGLVHAVNRGVCDVAADIDAGIDAVARRDPAIDRAANRARLAGTLGLEMSHPEGARLGIGAIDDARLERSIDLIVAAKGHARRPAAAEIFRADFLPPLAARPTHLARQPGQW
ncbi:MAG: ABC transporter substrate-binding protein [Burkholderiales bacterium]|nr:ABC transporter substrate-binding protein [Burkholderiales bacterium]